jgi:phenylpropionate dioxygenase-like ring-hydroxylating dioxygenase large terminal subunit
MSPFPSGWFRIGASAELHTGDVKPLRYFGRDLVLFRPEDGKAHLLDAHCPHLGAHLGYGGRIKGNTVQCPFHGWQWNGKGQCDAIPYTDNVAPNTAIRSWPVKEVNGQIMAYHDEQGAAPAWDVPEMPEYRSPDWLPFRFAHRWKIRTHVQELGENGMDIAHFPCLHNQQTATVESLGLEISGPFLTHRVFQRYNIFSLVKLLTPEVKGPLDIHLYGLGFFLNRAVVQTKIEMRYAFAFFFTPIDDEYVEGYSMLSMEKTLGRVLTHFLLRKAIREGGVTIGQDIPIWENKLFRPQPRLCEGDGPIMEYRRWASQFYP